MDLITTILAWDLNRGSGLTLSASSFGFGQPATSATSDPIAMQLSPAWLDRVLAAPLLQWALSALRSVGHRGDAPGQFVVHLRTFLVQLCCLSGKTLQDREAARRTWASFCMYGIMAVRLPDACTQALPLL